MQIEVTDQIENEIKNLIATGAFSCASEVVEAAVCKLVQEGPSVESFIGKLTEAHQSAKAGDLEPLDVEGIKQRGRARLEQSRSTE